MIADRNRSGDGPRLRGLRVAVTRSADQAESTRRELEAAGAQVLMRPLIRIETLARPERLIAAVRSVLGYDWIVFTSANAADRFASALDAAGMSAADLATVRVAAVGPSTAAVLELSGLRVDILPREYTASSVAAALAARADLAGARVLWPRAQGANPELARVLEARGATVDGIEAYKTVPDWAAGKALRDEVGRGGVDVLTFTSPSAVRAFAPEHTAWPCGARIAAIGPVTAAEARKRGLVVDVQPDEHTASGLVAALEDHFAPDRQIPPASRVAGSAPGLRTGRNE